MTQVAVALLWLAVDPPAAPREPSRQASVTLYARYEEEPSERIVSAMQAELGEILSEVPVAVRWRDLSSRPNNEVVPALAVVEFHGECRVRAFVPKPRPHGLGWTHITDGAVLPFVAVDCDRVRDFLGPELRFGSIEEREEALGRALARVLAHELWHVFANTRGHADGLARSHYSRCDLMADEFSFSDRECEILRSGQLGRREQPAVLP